MTITKYGLDVFIKSLMLLFIVGCLSWYGIGHDIVRYSIVSVIIVIICLVINFFRDPDRTTPNDERSVISPADGKIVIIKDVVDNEYLKGDAIQVSIFMSPLNVHVNRFPITGTVEFFQHVQGEYIVAFDEKSSERNERTLIGVQDEGYKVLFKQIAGAVARRIVAPISVGQKAVRGERFGMIKFGSRVDVLMPRSSHINVQLNDRVVAGETIIATYS